MAIGLCSAGQLTMTSCAADSSVYMGGSLQSCRVLIARNLQLCAAYTYCLVLYGNTLSAELAGGRLVLVELL